MNEYEDITMTEAEGVVTLTLNRPQALNAMRTQTLNEIIRALEGVRDGGSARMLLLTGAGRAFSSGADAAG